MSITPEQWRAMTKRNKYRAKPTEVDGMRFDSQAEARYYEYLKALVKTGEVEYFLRQVPLHLPGGVILRIDFMPMWWQEDDERLRQGLFGEYQPRYIDVKGHITREFKTKKRIAEATYPITIETVKWVKGRWEYST